MPVEVVACMLADKNSWKRLQFQLILQCAPLFKGYKVACITNVRREDMRNMLCFLMERESVTVHLHFAETNTWCCYIARHS